MCGKRLVYISCKPYGIFFHDQIPQYMPRYFFFYFFFCSAVLKMLDGLQCFQMLKLINTFNQQNVVLMCRWSLYAGSIAWIMYTRGDMKNVIFQWGYLYTHWWYLDQVISPISWIWKILLLVMLVATLIVCNEAALSNVAIVTATIMNAFEFSLSANTTSLM